MKAKLVCWVAMAIALAACSGNEKSRLSYLGNEKSRLSDLPVVAHSVKSQA